jgi:hypothetical protein
MKREREKGENVKKEEMGKKKEGGERKRERGKNK